MSHTVNLFMSVDALVKGVRHQLGNKNAISVTLTASEEVDHKQYTLAASGTQLVWQASSTESANVAFTAMAFITDKNIDVEMICDVNNGVGTKVWTQRVPANMPFLLPSKVAFANATADFASGTADLIEKISIRNATADEAHGQVMILN